MASQSMSWAASTRLVGIATVVMLLVAAGDVRAQGAPANAAPAAAPAAAAAAQNGGDADRPGLFAEPPIIGRTIEYFSRFFSSGEGGDTKSGFYPEFGEMITDSGWISVGPGYRLWLFDDRAVVDASAGVSWRLFKVAQARFELPALANNHVSVGTQVRWQDLTQLTYYGVGADAAEADRSEYRMQTNNVVGYAAVRPVPWISVNGRVGWLGKPSLNTPTGSFQRGNPYAGDTFPDDPVFLLPEQPNYLHGEASVVADNRDYADHPSRGGVYRAAWMTYSDRDAAAFSFDRYEAEALHFIPLAERRLVFALHGWLAASDTVEGDTIPFYLMPSLGGANTIRAYGNYRFHDRNMVVANAEARVAVFEHIDAAVFADAGNVAPRLGDLDFSKRAYGFGFRVHSRGTTFSRLDVAHGDEGWRLMFRMSDPFKFARLTRRTAVIPFVP